MNEEYYRVRAYIDEAALRYNIRQIRQKIGEKTWMLGVVKADAYGHGVENVVPILEEEGVQYLAVAILEEGIRIRQLGCRLPILLLGYTDPSQYADLLAYQLTPAIFHEDEAAFLSALAVKNGSKVRIHLKVDTGMGRIGLPCTDAGVAEALRIAALPGLEVEGLFTHFARADEKNKTEAEKQWRRYRSFLQELEKNGLTIPVRHAANSAAIMEYPPAWEEEAPAGAHWMVRAGIMLYGLYPSHEMDRAAMVLRPVLNLMSHVVHVKEVEDGTPIGYGGTYMAQGRRRIATIPVGYGDGYPRRFSGEGYVMIRGQRAPIAGRVCMDQMMVDVTGIPGVERGCPVTLIGEGVTAEDIADAIGTIHYEIVCQLSNRVPRVLKTEKNGIDREKVG